ncbi:HAD-superfamily hydrolase subfamily IA, variant 3 [Zychaea mexicana]|uniref:HAD-superfamily hydrolase subfamily IA, variant 3 n=1 Tax=Zychaea mexicana TaxID=64656 RepID=UPI0022FDD644|nr:HAD-superfamily hydrolase subfamily IA, variant 3 [Zychaea mexicana]KAI9484811.1 HAD-superfamily hydrolase subfamily IA, variant 3 [Zychaea mexicana]
MSLLPKNVLRAKAFVFDLDGTLIDTTPLVEQHWRDFALEHDLDAEKILASSHGRRTIETIAAWVPHKATLEVAEEYERKLAQKTEGLSVLPGVTALLEKIPLGRMGICTAGNKFMAETRLGQCGMAVPTVMSTGDTVTRGKPDPEGYLAAAVNLGADPKDCIVFEDAPAGVRAATAAGMQSIACTTTHTAEQLKEANATYVVRYLTDVDVVTLPDGTFEVIVTEAL